MEASVKALLADARFAGSEWQWQEGTVISYNRNMAMEKGTPLSEFDYVLFVDCDVAFTPDHVCQLIARNVDVVSAAVEARGFPGRASAAVPCAVPDAVQCRPSMSDTGMLEVVWAGAAMLLVRSKVFENWPYPWRYGTLPNGLQTGEDVQLCLDLREKGYKIWLDLDCKVEHIGANQKKGANMTTKGNAQTQKQPIPITTDAVVRKFTKAVTELQNLVTFMADEHDELLKLYAQKCAECEELKKNQKQEPA